MGKISPADKGASGTLPMDAAMLQLGLAICVLLSLLAVVAMYILRNHRRARSESESIVPAQQARPETATARGGSSRMRATQRQLQQRRAARNTAAAATSSTAYAASDDSGSEVSGDEEEGVPLTAADKKAARKEEKRRAKEEAREAREAANESRQGKVSAYEERRRRREEEREAQEAAEEEERRMAEKERQRLEDAEAAKWVGMISVEGAGTEVNESQEDGQGAIQRFVTYIQERKMVGLEELAAEFGLRTPQVVERLQSLEAMGHITGVMDDRGKFIYVSLEEMKAVADYLCTRGRISIAELAHQSNRLVDLEPKSCAVTAAGGPALDFESLLLDVGA